MFLFPGCLDSSVASCAVGFVLLTSPRSCVASLKPARLAGSAGNAELSVCLSAGTSPQLRPSVGCASGPSQSWLTSWVLLGLEPGSCWQSPSSTSTSRSSSRSRARWAAWEPFSSEPMCPWTRARAQAPDCRAGCSYRWSALLWHRDL